MKKIVVIVLALTLSGCATQFGTRIADTISAVSNFSVTQGQLDTARLTYNGAVLAPLRRYALLPRCKTGQSISINLPCHDRALLKKLRSTDKIIAAGFYDTQIKIDIGDNSGAVLAYDTLMTTIELAKTLIGKSGVNVL